MSIIDLFEEHLNAKHPREIDQSDLVPDISYRDFIRQMWHVIEPNTPLVWGWHLDAICEHIEAAVKFEIPLLYINVPPRTGKSQCASVFLCPWVWTYNPWARFMYSSYAQDLSYKHSVDARTVINSPAYKALWGDVYKLSGDQNVKSFFQNNHQGHRLATSVGGSSTGLGADIIIADDLVSAGQKDSAKYIKAANDSWDQVLSTRVNNPDKCAKIIIQQRISEKDLTGHVMEQGGFESLVIPMEYEGKRAISSVLTNITDPRKKQGELLHPERTSTQKIGLIKKQMGSYGWAGQYQQRPAPREGGMFKKMWFLDAGDAVGKVIARVRYWDKAATKDGGDYTVGVLMAKTNKGEYIIEDVRRKQGSAMEVYKLITDTAGIDGRAVKIYFELEGGSAAKGEEVYLIRELAGYTVAGRRQSQSKATRAEPFSAQCEAGSVFLAQGSWRYAFIDELSVFPNGAHDDQVDAAVGAFTELVSDESTAFRPFSIPDSRPRIDTRNIGY